uniref:(northern house mosquito) hypothetical protein n=1 Tax=Culex pipiens TaxID=7175 RepID=A0A8D8KGN0_CULPI
MSGFRRRRRRRLPERIRTRMSTTGGVTRRASGFRRRIPRKRNITGGVKRVRSGFRRKNRNRKMSGSIVTWTVFTTTRTRTGRFTSGTERRKRGSRRLTTSLWRFISLATASPTIPQAPRTRSNPRNVLRLLRK